MEKQVPDYESAAPVLVALEGPLAIISLNRPRFGNAQNMRMLYALDDALRLAADNDAVRAIVLRAEGKHFSSGHDIGTPGRDDELPRAERRSLWGDFSDRRGAERAYVREQESYLQLVPTVA